MSGSKPPDPDKIARKWRDRLFRPIIACPMPHFDRVAYRATIEAYAIRVGKVWQHIEELKHQEEPPEGDSREPRSRRPSRPR